MAADECKGLMGCIDKESVVMQHMPVMASLAKEQAQAMA
jgi:hypothetical protein